MLEKITYYLTKIAWLSLIILLMISIIENNFSIIPIIIILIGCIISTICTYFSFDDFCPKCGLNFTQRNCRKIDINFCPECGNQIKKISYKIKKSH